MAARGCLLPSLVLLLLAASLLGVSHAARKGPVSDDLWEDLPAVQVLNPQGDPTNPCGHFDANDLQDAGNAHQPCYGALGEFLHCW